jgi:hypothetical protein
METKRPCSLFLSGGIRASLTLSIHYLILVGVIIRFPEKFLRSEISNLGGFRVPHPVDKNPVNVCAAV